MRNEAAAFCEVRAGVFLTPAAAAAAVAALSPPQSLIRQSSLTIPNLPFVNRTHCKGLKRGFFQTIDAFITSFYDSPLIAEWLLMATVAVLLLRDTKLPFN